MVNSVVTEGYFMVYTSKKLKRKFLSHYQCLMARDSQHFRFVETP